MVEILLQVAANLQVNTEHIYFQSHTESLYSFMLYQPPELWAYQAVVLRARRQVFKNLLHGVQQEDNAYCGFDRGSRL